MRTARLRRLTPRDRILEYSCHASRSFALIFSTADRPNRTIRAKVPNHAVVNARVQPFFAVRIRRRTNCGRAVSKNRVITPVQPFKGRKTGGEKVTQYIIEGNIVDTNNAVASWADVLDKTETGLVSKYTGSGYHRATLYKSRRGRYYMTHSSTLAREPVWAEWVSPECAAVFLIRNDIELPDDLKKHYGKIGSLCEKTNKKLEDASALEIAQHLCDHITDFCYHCRVFEGTVATPKQCVFDERLEHCLANDTAGVCAKHNYSVNRNFKPEDHRHWNVSERMSEEELAELMRANS